MVEIFPVVSIGRSAQYCLHVHLSGTSGFGTGVASANNSINLGAMKTVEIVGGYVNGMVATTCGATVGSGGVTQSNALTGKPSAYVELRKSDNTTVVGRVGLPVTNPVKFSNVQYIYIYIKAAYASDSSASYKSGGSAYVGDACVYFNVL
jgi:hypothetical protein